MGNDAEKDAPLVVPLTQQGALRAPKDGRAESPVCVRVTMAVPLRVMVAATIRA